MNRPEIDRNELIAAMLKHAGHHPIARFPLYLAEQHYLLRMCDILAAGETHSDRTGVGTLSLFGTQILHNMNGAFPLLTTRKIDLELVFNELRWFLSGSTNVQDLPDNTKKWWRPWADENGELGPIYGKQLRDAHGRSGQVDQLRELLTMIDTQPASRRLIMTTWNAADVQAMRLPCCHGLVIQFKTHDVAGEPPGLSLSTYQRSADWPIGTPANLASYGLLLEMVAWATRRKPVRLVYAFGDYHIYLNQIEGCMEQVDRSMLPPPRLRINLDRNAFDNSWDSLMAIRWEHIELIDYQHHSPIKFPVAV